MSASSSTNPNHAELAAQLLAEEGGGGFEVVPLDTTPTALTSVDQTPLSTDKAHEVLEVPCGDVGENW